MTVILVNEDNHDLLTVAKDYKSAIKFLIDNKWIRESTECWNEKNDWWASLKEVLGENCLDIMILEWDIDDFNDFWTGNFVLEEVEVYE